MKKLILTLAIAATLTGCSATKDAQSSYDARCAEISWAAFCAARGYDINDNTYQATNEYLDSWCGSADEEAAYIAAGIDPYKH